MSPHPDSTVVERQSGSALPSNAAAWADHVVFVVDGRVHDVMDRPSPDSVLDVMKGLGR